MNEVRERIAGAPITWGVCEVPGWGHQLSPERVLAEMASLGLAATELGPQGFLPSPPDQLLRVLQGYGLQLVGGFLPVVLHERSRRAEELEKAETAISQLAAGGADVLVLAADTGEAGYEQSSTLDREGWHEVASSIDAIEEAATRRGLSVSLHPHYGTLVESPQQVEALLAASPVSICLDTGHLLAGGGDPVALARDIPDRITHCHLKDVDAEMAAAVRGGRLSYYQAVKQGMYRSLGEGDVDVGAIVSTLEHSGYRGWYVLEHDVVLDDDPAPEAGPVESARRSLGYLEALLTRVPG